MEGIPVAVAVARGHGFVNLGTDWLTHFTIFIEPRDLKLFRSKGINIRDIDNR